jgi:ABC-2 type transport system ATP-binding protein
MDMAIRIQGLVKTYGDLVAVNGLDLEIRRGECFGLLGPNGAGKTTTVEIMEGLVAPTSGMVEVLGQQWSVNAGELRPRIGVTLQETMLLGKLTVEETVGLYRSFYRGRRVLDVHALLSDLKLDEKRSTWVERLSGGERQRLAIALSLVGDPELLFLDEPTTGLDPHSRRALWETISALHARGKTVVLTTHYMDEAERLCDRVGIVNRGRLIELGSPAELIDGIGGHHLVELATMPPVSAESLSGLTAVRGVRAHGDGIVLSVSAPHLSLPALFARLSAQGAVPTRVVSRTATLDDVFLCLTGQTLREN